MTLTLTEAKQCIKELDRDGLEKLIDQYSEDVVKAAIECGINLDDIEECYSGEFSSDEAFAQDMAEQLGTDKSPAWPNNCIDWEYAAKELMYD